MRILVLFILIFLSSCGKPNFATERPLVQPTPTTFPNEDSAQTLEPSATKTQYDTDTPLATYTSNQAYQKIKGWLGDNGGCQLPCVWGFQPGVTDRDQIEDLIFSKFDEMYIGDAVSIWINDFDELGGITLILEKSGIQSNIRMAYFYKGTDHVQLISLLIDSHLINDSTDNSGPQYLPTNEMLQVLIKHYTLASVLEEYGKPSSVLIAPYYKEDPGGVPPSWIWYSVVLVYEEQGFLAEFIMPRRMIGDYYAACSNQMAELTIIGWDPSQSIELPEIVSVKSGLGINRTFVDYFKPLEEATSITLEDFFGLFRDPDSTECVYTPLELWPGP